MRKILKVSGNISTGPWKYNNHDIVIQSWALREGSNNSKERRAKNFNSLLAFTLFYLRRKISAEYPSITADKNHVSSNEKRFYRVQA